MHCVSNYVRSKKRAISLDEIPSGSIVCEPTQVDRLIALKRRGSLGCAVPKLTARERQLFQLLCRDEVTAAEVAKEMGIKVESVHRRKHALIKKLQEIIDSPVGPKKKRRPKNK